MSDFTISNDWRRNPNPTQAHLDWLADMLRQCRTEQDIEHDDAAEQREFERFRDQQEWTER